MEKAIVTRKDWNDDLSIQMVWSIPNKEDNDAENALIDELCPKANSGEITKKELESRLSEAFNNVRLDFSAPDGLPDGIYSVYHKTGGYQVHGQDRYEPAVYGVALGLIIKDGKFEPRSTDKACYEAVCRSYDVVPYTGEEINHIFIEDLKYDSERNAIKICTGS